VTRRPWYRNFNDLDVWAQIVSGRLASISISRLRASGVVTKVTKSVDIVFGEGNEGLRREVKVVHRRFPNGGEWSFFLCPTCSRRARVLRVHDKPTCRRCCLREGIGYRVSSGSPVERDVARMARLHKLRELLDGGPVRLHPRPGRKLDRRWSLTVSWRRGMIRERSGRSGRAGIITIAVNVAMSVSPNVVAVACVATCDIPVQAV
jgi:hypothetical protein